MDLTSFRRSLRVFLLVFFFFFFFQAEDGIRDIGVTGVQTCALPICGSPARAIQHGVGERAIRYREWQAILDSCGFGAESLSPVAGRRVRARWLRRLGNAARPIYVAIRLTR